MEICKKENCTGCYACVNSCARNCINMCEDELGVLHPVVDTEKCVECGACIRVCPANTTVSSSLPSKCYAVINDNKKEILTCATSGLGWMISQYTLLNKGGVVFATLYDKQMTPRITEIDNLADLERTKGSKYVQSIVGETTFQRIRELLKNNVFVTFIGTPCQVAGLKQFLKKDYANLLLVDLLCHGVVPTRYFKEELSHLSQQHQLKDITDVRFRGNDGNNYILTIWGKDGDKIYSSRAYSQPYFSGFMIGTTLRENCFNCQYAKVERVGDLTIGDFIGLGATIPFEYEKENISFVSVNTPKGVENIERLRKHYTQLHFIERSYEERLVYANSLLKPTLRHPSVKKFRALYPTHGYVQAIRSALKKELLWAQTKEKLIWLKPLVKLFKK